MKIICDICLLKIRDQIKKKVFFFWFQTLLFFWKVMQRSQELHCELDPLPDHYVLWKVTWPQNECKFVPLPCSLLLNHNLPKWSFQLHFQVFSIPFSISFLYLSFISTFTEDYFCHIIKKEEQNLQTSSAFKAFHNRTARVQVRNSSL